MRTQISIGWAGQADQADGPSDTEWKEVPDTAADENDADGQIVESVPTDSAPAFIRDPSLWDHPLREWMVAALNTQMNKHERDNGLSELYEPLRHARIAVLCLADDDGAITQCVIGTASGVSREFGSWGGCVRTFDEMAATIHATAPVLLAVKTARMLVATHAFRLKAHARRICRACAQSPIDTVDISPIPKCQPSLIARALEEQGLLDAALDADSPLSVWFARERGSFTRQAIADVLNGDHKALHHALNEQQRKLLRMGAEALAKSTATGTEKGTAVPAAIILRETSVLVFVVGCAPGCGVRPCCGTVWDRVLFRNCQQQCTRR